jgi:hypothetical protein
MSLVRASVRVCWASLLATTLVLAGPVWGQSANSARGNGSDTQKSPTLIESSPTWAELTERQQAALEPLAKFWPGMNQARKRKWLAVSRNYHELPAEEQQTMQERMREWVSLSPREQAQARLEYARAQTLTIDERRARWEAYLALSEEERKKLANHPPRKPKGAAIALHPVPAPKIVPPPQPAHVEGQGFSALRIDTDKIHPRTLLPLNVSGHASP